jgi:hypothetical protein
LNTVEGKLLIKITETFGPDILRLGVKQIKEDTRLRIDELLNRIIGTVLSDKRLSLESLGHVLALAVVLKTSINDGDETLVALLPALSGSQVELERFRSIDTEVLMVFHIGGVEPDTVERDLLPLITSHVDADVIERLVAKRGSVPAESPEGRQTRLASNVLVARDDLFGSSLHEDG